MSAAIAVWAFAAHPRPARAARARLAWRRPRVRRRRRPAVDVGEFVAEVATRLRSGVGADVAWSRTARRWGLPEGVDDDGAPRALAALPPGAAVSGARAAARLAFELGSPLADMLDGCASSLTRAEANEAARRIALAGPVASAKLLAGLPALGLVLGSFVGADPVGQLAGGGLGTVVGLVGLALYVAGMRWSAALVTRARDETAVAP